MRKDDSTRIRQERDRGAWYACGRGRPRDG